MTVLRFAVVGLIVGLVPTMLDAGGFAVASRPRSASSCLAVSSARVIVIGRSVQGRPIRAYRIGDVNEPVRILVVGAIAGDEPGGVEAARDLLGARPVGEVVIWVILTVNPDGLAAGVRQNADGVDLNRNFPWHWHRLGGRGFRFYAGPRPLSEPESRATRLFILRIRPDVTIWLHQPYGLVERRSDASLRIEQRFAALIKLPLLPLPPLPGIAIGWQNNTLRPSTAMDAELYAPLSAPAARRAAQAVTALAHWAAGAVHPPVRCAVPAWAADSRAPIGADRNTDHADHGPLA